MGGQAAENGKNRWNRWNRWNRRFLRLAAAALTVFLFSGIFRPEGGNISEAQRLQAEIKKEQNLRAEQTEKMLSISARGIRRQAEAYGKSSHEGRESRFFYADLTHDGQDELIVLEIKGNPSDFSMEALVTVLAANQAGEVCTIYEKQIDQSHTGWCWLYLYEKDGLDYLAEYDPVLYEGISRYSFTVFSLTPEGKTVNLVSDVLEFEWNGEAGKDLEDQVKAFNQKAFSCLEQSRVIAAAGEEYFSGIQVCETGDGL